MRFWHFQRVGKSFRAHIRAGARRYQYVLPTFVFRPTRLPTDVPFVFDESARAKVQLVMNRFVGTHRFHLYTQCLPFNSQQANRTIGSFEVRRIATEVTTFALYFPIHSDPLSRFNELRWLFHGIQSFQCGTPFMSSCIEWVQLTVMGTSFVLNQIRKMVGKYERFPSHLHLKSVDTNVFDVKPLL